MRFIPQKEMFIAKGKNKDSINKCSGDLYIYDIKGVFIGSIQFKNGEIDPSSIISANNDTTTKGANSVRQKLTLAGGGGGSGGGGNSGGGGGGITILNNVTVTSSLRKFNYTMQNLNIQSAYMTLSRIPGMIITDNSKGMSNSANRFFIQTENYDSNSNGATAYKDEKDKDNSPCPGNPLVVIVIASSSGSGIKGGTLGCTRSGGNQFHDGIDLYAQVGTSLFAQYDGVLVDLNNSFKPNEYKPGSHGNFVIMKYTINGTDYYVKYNHLNNLNVTQNDRGKTITAGSELGLTGRTGNAGWREDLNGGKGGWGCENPHVDIQMRPENNFSKGSYQFYILSLDKINAEKILNPKTKIDKNSGKATSPCK